MMMSLTSQVKVVQKVMSGWLMVSTSMKVVWKSATTTCGVLSVMTYLTDKTVLWFVDSWDLVMQV